MHETYGTAPCTWYIFSKALSSFSDFIFNKEALDCLSSDQWGSRVKVRAPWQHSTQGRSYRVQDIDGSIKRGPYDDQTFQLNIHPTGC